MTCVHKFIYSSTLTSVVMFIIIILQKTEDKCEMVSFWGFSYLILNIVRKQWPSAFVYNWILKNRAVNLVHDKQRIPAEEPSRGVDVLICVGLELVKFLVPPCGSWDVYAAFCFLRSSVILHRDGRLLPTSLHIAHAATCHCARVCGTGCLFCCLWDQCSLVL